MRRCPDSEGRRERESEGMRGPVEGGDTLDGDEQDQRIGNILGWIVVLCAGALLLWKIKHMLL